MAASETAIFLFNVGESCLDAFGSRAYNDGDVASPQAFKLSDHVCGAVLCPGIAGNDGDPHEFNLRGL